MLEEAKSISTSVDILPTVSTSYAGDQICYIYISRHSTYSFSPNAVHLCNISWLSCKFFIHFVIYTSRHFVHNLNPNTVHLHSVLWLTCKAFMCYKAVVCINYSFTACLSCINPNQSSLLSLLNLNFSPSAQLFFT